MSKEDVKDLIPDEQDERENRAAAAAAIVIEKFAKGRYELQKPIRAAGKDVEELEYDFLSMTGMEYAEALDTDPTANNALRISNKQAFQLFAVAAAKATTGIDAIDIIERMGATDTMKAIQIATVFFFAAAREGDKRITNK